MIAKNDVIELWAMPTFFPKCEQNKAAWIGYENTATDHLRPTLFQNVP